MLADLENAKKIAKDNQGRMRGLTGGKETPLCIFITQYVELKYFTPQLLYSNTSKYQLILIFN